MKTAQRVAFKSPQVGLNGRKTAIPATSCFSGLNSMNPLNSSFYFAGTPVFVVPDVPKRQLALDVPVTDAFRREINAWMIEFFGLVNTMVDGEVISLSDQDLAGVKIVQAGVYMNPRTFMQVKALFPDKMVQRIPGKRQ